MPGSPPISTSEPGTMPPPSTWLSSRMPRRSRLACANWTSASGMGRAVGTAARRPAPPRLEDSALTCSSTYVFQLPHSGQRPSHLVDWLPHSWQAKTERDPFVVFTFGSNYRGRLRQLPVVVWLRLADHPKQYGRLRGGVHQGAGCRHQADGHQPG